MRCAVHTVHRQFDDERRKFECHLWNKFKNIYRLNGMIDLKGHVFLIKLSNMQSFSAKKGKSKWIFYEDHQSICSDDNDNWKLNTQLCTKQNLWTRSEESVKKLFFFLLFHTDSIMCATLMCFAYVCMTILFEYNERNATINRIEQKKSHNNINTNFHACHCCCVHFSNRFSFFSLVYCCSLYFVTHSVICQMTTRT